MKNRKGSTLVLTLIVFAVLMIFATFTLGFMVTENKQSLYHQNMTQAYYIARSGAEAVEAAIFSMDDDELEEFEGFSGSQDISISGFESLFTDINGNIKNINIEKVSDGEEDPGRIIITSEAEVHGVSCSVTNILKGESRVVDPDKLNNVAIYAGENLNLPFNPTLAEGTSIYVSDDPNAVINVSNDKLKESIKRETLYFPPLKFDGIPNSDINSVPNTITTTTDPVIIVIDNNLTLNKLDVIGDGKIRIFVKGDLIIDANQPIGNKPNQIEIYCYGDSLSVEGNTEIYTDIYVYQAESVVFGQSKFYGLIYAPNSKFTSKANHEYYGIIAKEVTLKNAELNNPMAELKIPFDEGYLESSKNTVHYIEGHYK